MHSCQKIHACSRHKMHAHSHQKMQAHTRIYFKRSTLKHTHTRRCTHSPHLKRYTQTHAHSLEEMNTHSGTSSYKNACTVTSNNTHLPAFTCSKNKTKKTKKSHTHVYLFFKKYARTHMPHSL